MSGHLVGEVIRCAPTDLTPAQRLILIAIAEDARDKGAYHRTARYCSVTNLATWFNMSPGSVKNALGALTARGLIKPLHQGQIGRVQHYYLAELHDYHRNATTTPERPTG